MIRPITERGSPANLDAEEGLLACCILETGQDIITQCIEAKITPDYFFKPAHQLLFDAIRALYQSQSGIDEIILAEKLNTMGHLDAVGGHAEINRLTNRVETTAHARYWLEIVREKALQRRLISHATALVERAYSGENLEALLARGEASIAELITATTQGDTDAPPLVHPGKARAEAKLLARANALRFDLAKPPERRPPIVTLNGHPVCKKGDLMAFMAPNKSGKSSSLAAMLAATFAAPGADCLGFDAANPDGESVIHLMTEESIEDHWDMVNRSLRRGKVDAPPGWFQSYHLRRFSTEERRSFLFAKARASRPMRLLILDGAADFVEDSNDLSECKRFVDELLSLIDELQCAVAVTIHVNPSPKPTERDKGMGHLGSIIERKASSILLLKKEDKEGVGEVITINTKDARKGKASCPPRFVWSEELAMHIRYVGPTDIVSAPKQPGRSRVFTWERLATYFVEGMRPVAEWQETDMATLAARAGCSSATVRRLAAKYLAEEGAITHEIGT